MCAHFKPLSEASNLQLSQCFLFFLSVTFISLHLFLVKVGVVHIYHFQLNVNVCLRWSTRLTGYFSIQIGILGFGHEPVFLEISY